MLFTSDALDRIRAGETTMAFRRWKRPSVKAGGTITTAVGVLAIDAVEAISLDEVSFSDLRDAGLDSVEALAAGLHADADGRLLYRIRFHRLGDDPRISLRDESDIDARERSEIERRLAGFDRASRDGAWTEALLRLIGERPGTRSADLADAVGLDQPTFKRRVRNLKGLGLTESLETGYRLSARGRTYLDSGT